MLNLKTFLFILILLWSAKTDCPISRYHSQFRLGQVNAYFSDVKPQSTLQQDYIVSLDNPLALVNPSVLIGINIFDYIPSNVTCEFRVTSITRSSLTQLGFSIFSNGFDSPSTKFSFRYMILQAGYNIIQGGSFTSDVSKNKVTQKISVLSNSMINDPQIAMFLNGIKASYTNLVTLYIQLSNSSLKSNQLSFDLKTIPGSPQISSVSISYLLYSKSQFSQQNTVLLQTLNIEPSISTLPYNSLLYSELTFYGLSALTLKPTKANLIYIILDETNKFQTFGASDTLFKINIWQSFIKDSFICSFCNDGSILLQGKVCVNQCPKDFIVDNTFQIKTCKKCDISALKVPDSTNTKCICATQHYQNLANNQCLPCHFSCYTCVGPTQNDCLSCDTSGGITYRKLFPLTPKSIMGKCTCVQGFYQSQGDITCQKCHPDCKTCTNSGNGDCLQCNSQRIKNAFNLCECTNGYSSQEDGNCVCTNPKFQVNGLCMDPINTCDINEIPVGQNSKGLGRNLQSKNNGNNNNGNNKNNNPNSNNQGSNQNSQNGSVNIINNNNADKTASNNNSRSNKNPSSSASSGKPNSQFKSSCQCKSGFYKVKGQCVPCGLNMIYNDKKGRCQCVKQAEQVDGRCIICSSDKKFDRKTKTCQCQDKNASLNKSNDKCISCPKKSILYKNQCICINNYFMDSKGKCQKCTKNSNSPLCKKVQDDAHYAAN